MGMKTTERCYYKQFVRKFDVDKVRTFSETNDEYEKLVCIHRASPNSVNDIGHR